MHAELTLRHHAALLRRRWFVVVLVAVVVTVVGTAPALLEESSYAATASVRGSAGDPPAPVAVTEDDEASPVAAGTVDRDVMEALADVEVIESPGMRADVAAELGERAAGIESVSAVVPGYTTVVRIRVVADDPQLAADAANAYAAHFTERQRDALTADELGTDAEGRIAVLSEATPPTSPEPRGRGRALAISAVLGLVVGCGVVVVPELLRGRITGLDDLDGLLPDVEALGAVALSGPDRDESQRRLRSALRRRAVGTTVRTLAVVGATDDAAAATVAVGIATTAADAGASVVFVDAGGMATTDPVAGAGIEVVTAGPSEGDEGPVDSERFERAVADAAQRADLVVLSAPPADASADAVVVAGVSDTTIVVARVGLSRRRDVRDLLVDLRRAGVPVLGTVATTGDRPTA